MRLGSVVGFINLIIRDQGSRPVGAASCLLVLDAWLPPRRIWRVEKGLMNMLLLRRLLDICC